MLSKMLASSLAFTGTTIAESINPIMLANTCSGCHGTNGQSSGLAIPTISGLGVDYFIQIMQNYKNGKAASTVMGRLAKGYTDDDFKAMAEYYAKQPFSVKAQEYDVAKAAAGAELHKEYCEYCHENGGKSAESSGTMLAGQWMKYLRFTIADLHSKKRNTNIKFMQKKLDELVKKVGEPGIENLVNFYGSYK